MSLTEEQKNRLKNPELPNLNPPKRPNTQPQPDRPEYRAQNGDAITGAIALRASDASSSLQSLDSRLSSFEDRFADAAVERIDSMPVRIQQKIATRLQERQQEQIELVNFLDAFAVPDFPLPQAAIACGILPAAY